LATIDALSLYHAGLKTRPSEFHDLRRLDLLPSCCPNRRLLLAFSIGRAGGASTVSARGQMAVYVKPTDCSGPPWPRSRRRALNLAEDPAILTAVANDIGPASLYSRQVIAYGRPGDVALALSTSGSSPNIIEALAEARKRGLVTIACVGYDGGRIAAERLADHVMVTPSEHIPRIQEAQATAYHALRELVG